MYSSVSLSCFFLSPELECPDPVWSEVQQIPSLCEKDRAEEMIAFYLDCVSYNF